MSEPVEDPQQRKHPTSDTILNEREAKRSRPNPNSTEDDAATGSNHSGDCSVEDLLSVPLELIFRKVPSSAHSLSASQRRKPLLTRAEAQCLVKTSQLACKVDAITEMASKALWRQRWCRMFSDDIVEVPLLRSILPILAVHGNRIPTNALVHIQSEMERVLMELETCASSLRQYSEQNWTLVESLLDAFGDDSEAQGSELAKEKRKLGELHEEVCARIDNLIGIASVREDNAALTRNFQDAFEQATDSKTGRVVSMQEFCDKLFGKEVDEDELMETPVDDGKVVARESTHPTSSQTSNDSGKQFNFGTAPDQWSGSTVPLSTPACHARTVPAARRPDGSYEALGEMTQGTTSAIEALRVLASGGRGGSESP